MLAAALLAGFFAAHAVWSVSDGETLIPIYAYDGSDGQRHMQRLQAESFDDAIQTGRTELKANTVGATNAVLIYDGYLTLGDERLDALFLEIHSYGDRLERYVLAIPYRPKTDTTSFTVFRPKLLEVPEGRENQLEPFLESFWAGVDSHKQGSEIWNASIDQSR
jgi:hypothetical protein